MGPRIIEFCWVYDADGRLRPDDSLWMITDTEAARPTVRWLTYAGYRQAMGGRALPFRDFARPNLPLDEVDRWFEAARATVEEARYRVHTQTTTARME